MEIMLCTRCGTQAIAAHLIADGLKDMGDFPVTVALFHQDACDWNQLMLTHDTDEHDGWAASMAGMRLAGWPG